MESGDANGSVSHDVVSLLQSPDRDFLVRNNGDQVKIEDLKGKKKLGLYFSASWSGPCKGFTKTLVEVYNELASKGELEIVLVTADQDDGSFKVYFSKMPWLAIPISDSETRSHLDKLFNVPGIPYLVILDENGQVLTERGVGVIREYGVESYPFSPERIKELKEQGEMERENQSLRSLLVNRSRDYVVSADGSKVPISELEGKMVGLYFSLSSYQSSVDFTAKLAEVYGELTARGENFEIVLVSLDDQKESFDQSLAAAPWLAFPFKDRCCEKLARYFSLSTVPTLVVIGPDGKTVHHNVAEAIEEHGALAYPFTPEKFEELVEIEKAKEAALNLESVLASGDRDFFIGKDGSKILVSDLVGKNILLYFSAPWREPWRTSGNKFLLKLIEIYQQIKAKDDAFEVIFISSDSDEESFNDFFSRMPWLALPYGDERMEILSSKFKVHKMPTVIAIGPTGRTVTKEAIDHILAHGSDAYPFTDERLKELEAKYEEMAKGWPKKLTSTLHEDHELVLSRRKRYVCDGCNKGGRIWSFLCEDCDFDLHPNCALKGENETKDDEKDETKDNDGCTSDGEVCREA